MKRLFRTILSKKYQLVSVYVGGTTGLEITKSNGQQYEGHTYENYKPNVDLSVSFPRVVYTHLNLDFLDQMNQEEGDENGMTVKI